LVVTCQYSILIFSSKLTFKMKVQHVDSKDDVVEHKVQKSVTCDFQIEGRSMIFGNIWPEIIADSTDDEIVGDFKDIQSTMGIIGALLMSIVYGRVGRLEDVNPNCMWSDHANIGQHLLTLVNHTNIIVCLYITIISARAYVMLSCFPVDHGKECVDKLGPFFLMDTVYISMPIITSLFLLDTILRTSLTLPWILGVISVAATIVVAGTAIWSFTVLDKRGVKAILTVAKKYRNRLNQ